MEAPERREIRATSLSGIWMKPLPPGLATDRADCVDAPLLSRSEANDDREVTFALGWKSAPACCPPMPA